MAQVEHIHLVCPAETRNRLHQRVEHGIEVNGRTADDLQYLRGRALPFLRLIPLTGEQRNPLVRIDGSFATTRGLRRIAALQRLAALRFYRFADRFVASSHCLTPEAKTS